MLQGARERLRQRWKEEQLAGSARAGAYARKAAFRTQLDFLKANKRPFAVAVAGLAALAPAMLVLPARARLFALGFLCGAGPVALYYTVVLVSGSANVLLGDVGEQRTRDALRRYQKRGWKVIHGFRVDGDDDGDIDTIAVGPGGIAVIETKWSSSAWSASFMAPTIDRATRQALRGCVRVREYVNDLPPALSPRAAVVLWSPRDGRPRARTTRADIMLGDDLTNWLDALKPEVLAPAEIERIWRDLDAVTSRSQLTDWDGRPLPSTPGEYYRAFLATVAGFFAAPFVASVMPRHRLAPTLGFIGIAAALGTWRVKPRTAARHVAIGALASCAFILVGAAIIAGGRVIFS